MINFHIQPLKILSISVIIDSQEHIFEEIAEAILFIQNNKKDSKNTTHPNQPIYTIVKFFKGQEQTAKFQSKERMIAWLGTYLVGKFMDRSVKIKSFKFLKFISGHCIYL